MTDEQIRLAVTSTFEARNGAKPEYHQHLVDDECKSLARHLRILDQAGFVCVPKEYLTAVLEPFAKAATDYYGDKPTDDATEAYGWLETRHITWGDLRRAATVFAALSQEKGRT